MVSNEHGIEKGLCKLAHRHEIWQRSGLRYSVSSFEGSECRYEIVQISLQTFNGTDLFKVIVITFLQFSKVSDNCLV